MRALKKIILHSKLSIIFKPFLLIWRRFYYKSLLGEIVRFKPYKSDKSYIKWLYKKRFHKKCNLEVPKTFNEKNNWRKLYDRKDIYTSMVDKYLVKEVISERVGQEHAIKLLGMWEKPRDIDFDSLPDQFVLKVNHAGGVIVCRDKSKLDKKKVIKELRQAKKINYFWRSREWPYKNVKRCIIAEEYIGENLIDYKNYCFNGRLEYTFVWENVSRADGRKPKAHFCGAYDRDWNRSEIDIDYPAMDKIAEKPQGYDKMVEVAEKMANGIPFVRVDCYAVNGDIYVGEMTFFPWGGFMKFRDEKWNRLLGDLEKLPGVDY